MPLAILNDMLDDAPDEVSADGFEGFDFKTDPTKLVASIARAGRNCWCDIDRLLSTRPGLKFNTLLTRTALGGGSHTPRGMGYYDIPSREAVLVSGDAKFYDVTDDGDNVTSNVLTPTPSATVDAYFAQLVDRMFWTDGTMRWSLYSAGWTHGTVVQFSDATAMPTWGVICSHGQRLLAYDPASDKIYASAVGTAINIADWVKTENVRVGSGEGDPVKWMISGQNGLLYVIKASSVWMGDTSNASAALWTFKRVTQLTGAVEGKTAVQVGQDIIFLSSFGVVSLGGLADTLSISPAKTLSYPVQTYIDRINKAAQSTAWAVMWRDQYLLAVPLDSATVPNYILPFNTTTGRWGAPWTSTLPTLTVSATDIPFTGWVCGVTTNFGDDRQTLICDNTGRVVRLDRDYDRDQYAAASTQEIESYATVKAFTHDLPGNFKQPMRLEVEWFNSTAQLVQVNLVRDGQRSYPEIALVNCESAASGLYTATSQGFPIHFPLEFLPNGTYLKDFSVRGFSRYRHASVQVYSTKRKLSLRAVRLASFIDAPALTN